MFGEPVMLSVRVLQECLALIIALLSSCTYGLRNLNIEGIFAATVRPFPGILSKYQALKMYSIIGKPPMITGSTTDSRNLLLLGCRLYMVAIAGMLPVGFGAFG